MNFESFVLTASTADLGDEPAAREHADAVEFRMDLADESLDALRNYTGALPVLATNRVEWEGGEAPDAPDRLAALSKAMETPLVEAVDVELAAIRDGNAQRVVDHAREQGVSVVVSVQHPAVTPPRPSRTRATTSSS